VTGAAGLIGSSLRADLARDHDVVGIDLSEADVNADIRDLSALERAFAGCSTVVHLAGISSVEATWPQVSEINVGGTYNAFEAARRAKVKRVIFASSNHAIGFHRRERFIDNSVVPRPDTRYGVSKVFGEAVGRLYADKYGMEVVCIRIGHVSVRPMYDVDRHIWISPRDLAQLLEIALERTPLHFEVLYGVSDNRLRWWSLDRARELGYRPKDAATERVTLKRPGPPTVGELVQGESFAARGFAGDTSRLWRPAQRSP